MKVETAIDRYILSLKANGKSPLTLKNYRWDLGHLTAYAKRIALDDINDFGSDNASELIDAYENTGKAPASVNRLKAALNGLFSYLHTSGQLFRIPFNLQYSKVVRPVPTDLGQVEREKLERVMGLRADLHLLLQLYLGKGLRLSEALALDVDDIVGKETFRVIGKGQKPRFLDVTTDLADAVQRWLPLRERILTQSMARSKRVQKRALFLNQWGWRLSERRAQQLMRARFQEVNLKRLSVHGLRHAFANNLRAQGVDIRTIQEILGHANVSTTQIYTHVTRSDVQRALKKESAARASSQTPPPSHD